MLISESDDGRATARSRQKAGKAFHAAKNSGEARRIISGGTNLLESTSCADMIIVFSSRRLRRAEHDCARDGSGAEQQSASANPKGEMIIEALAMEWRLGIIERRISCSSLEVVTGE